MTEASFLYLALGRSARLEENFCECSWTHSISCALAVIGANLAEWREGFFRWQDSRTVSHKHKDSSTAACKELSPVLHSPRFVFDAREQVGMRVSF
jgi:hypothetical protein